MKAPKIPLMHLALGVKKTIEKHRLIARGDGVLAAVSGGPDSIALLHALSGLREDLGFRLEVAHVEHGIRGQESKDDARFVAETADRLSLPFHLKEIELPAIKAARGGGNLEALAREERYRFFAQVAGARELGKIATGHTRDDQVETVIMRFLRGSGRKGLGAMAPVQSLEMKAEGGRTKEEGKIHPSSLIVHPLVVRPLIETARKEIEAYLAAENLPFRIDRTNFDSTLLRNWVRLNLLPEIREKIGPGIDVRLIRLAEILRDEERVLDNLTRAAFPCVEQSGTLLRTRLLEQPKALQRRLVRLWLEQASGTLKGVDFDHIDAVLRLIADGPPQGRIAVPKQREVVRAYDAIRLRKKTRMRGGACYSYPLALDGELAIDEAGMRIVAKRGQRRDVRPRDELEALFDRQALPETLTVRNFRAGDRFRPLGMAGHKKVKDLFIEKKLPFEVRATLPLVVAGEEVLWIPGYARSEIAKVGPATREILRLEVSAVGDRRPPAMARATTA